MQIQRLMAESRSTKTFCIHISIQGEQFKSFILVFKKLVESLYLEKMLKFETLYFGSTGTDLLVQGTEFERLRG